jgi:hypothetical protein
VLRSELGRHFRATEPLTPDHDDTAGHPMTTSTLTVTEFVLARIEEDEAWTLGADCEWERWADDEACKPEWDLPATDMPSHPARVLAQCAGMRKIVEESVALDGEYAGIGLSAAVRALASIWSDHLDWREEWR